MPKLFIGKEDQMGIIDFPTSVKLFISMGAGCWPIKFDKKMNIFLQFIIKSIFELVL
jgi:hypothetical protein